MKSLPRVYSNIQTNIKANEDDDIDLENLMIKEENDDDELANVYLEGLDLLKKTTTIIARPGTPLLSPSKGAMIIHTGQSDKSMSGMSGMSGVSNESKSTLGSVHWNKETTGKERTIESVRQEERENILYSCAKYQIQDNEAIQWIQTNTIEVEYHNMSIEKLQKVLPYAKWKQMVIDIKKFRKKRLRQQLGKQTKDEKGKESNEYDDPVLNRILEQASSSELLEPHPSPGTSLSNRARHPSSTMKLSNNPNANVDAKMGEESGWQ